MQRRVQRYGWDAAARIYDAAWRENLRPAHDAMFEMAAPEPGEAVLDVACGSGLVTFRAAEEVGPSGRVLATDISAEMVALVRERAEAFGLAQVTAERREAENLRLEEGAFDLALCGLGLMYVPEPLDAVKEMHRTLRTGGRMVAAVWGARENCGWAELFPIVDQVVQSEVCPLFFALGAGDSLTHTFERVGFRSQGSRRVSAVLNFDSESDLLAAFIDGGPVALAAKRIDATALKQVREGFLASVAQHRNGAGYEVPGEFVIVLGRKP